MPPWMDSMYIMLLLNRNVAHKFQCTNFNLDFCDRNRFHSLSFCFICFVLHYHAYIQYGRILLLQGQDANEPERLEKAL